MFESAEEGSHCGCRENQTRELSQLSQDIFGSLELELITG